MSSPSKDGFMRPMEYRPDVVPVKTRRQVLLDQLGLAGEKLFPRMQSSIVDGHWPCCNLFAITGQVKCGSKGFHSAVISGVNLMCFYTPSDEDIKQQTSSSSDSDSEGTIWLYVFLNTNAEIHLHLLV